MPETPSHELLKQALAQTINGVAGKWHVINITFRDGHEEIQSYWIADSADSDTELQNIVNEVTDTNGVQAQRRPDRFEAIPIADRVVIPNPV